MIAKASSSSTATWRAMSAQRYVDAAGLADPVIEVKLTPNRPDCTGVRGIARDLAAAGLGKLKPEPKIQAQASRASSRPQSTSSSISRPKRATPAPCFAGRYIKGVKNGPSPAWMQQRLKAVGLRPINALVDVTNYISHDRGRPLHVYDADKLHGAVRARLGKTGEKFVGARWQGATPSTRPCASSPTTTRPLGFGGIIGGEDTAARTTTKNVLIECAYFRPRCARRPRAARPASRQRCALPFRARRRPGLRPAPASIWPPHMMLEIVRRQALEGRSPVRRRMSSASSPSTRRRIEKLTA